MFWKFKTWIENQSGCRVKVIRSDNGTEYTTDKFVKFCEAAGIDDDKPIRGTMSLIKIYQRCNIAMFEPAGYDEVV